MTMTEPHNRAPARRGKGRPWTVDQHGPFEQLEDNLWWVQAKVAGFPVPIKRQMTVMRLTDGRLVLHSVVAMGEAEMATLEGLGEPAFIVVPNGFHRLDAWAYHERYPKAKVICPALSARKVSKRVDVDGHYDTFPTDAAVSVETLSGSRLGEGVFIVRSGPEQKRATLVFNDSFFNVPHIPGFAGRMYRLLGSSGGPRVPPLIKWFTVKDSRGLATHLRRLADIEGLVRAIPGHGLLVEGDVAGILRAAADKL